MHWPLAAAAAAAICPQPPKLAPQVGSDFFFSTNYTDYSAGLLGGAVKIRTESFDDMPLNPQDPRFLGLRLFNNYLEQSFPRAAEALEYVNNYGMLYTFSGKTSQMRPLLLTGHIDTVPVNEETLDQWDHDPFGGFYDGEWLHGRGAVDDKNTVVAILEAVEHLLGQGWVPERTLVLAFGFDEEIGGARGAASLAPVLLERYGKHAFEMVIDEGSGQPEIEGVQILGPFVAERGSLNTRIKVLAEGGHSSAPPEHTAIGYLTQIIESLESNPFEAGIKNWKTHPGAHLYQCIAENTKALPEPHRTKFLNLRSHSNLRALVDFIKARTSWMIWTSQAIDIVRAGTKINALAENAELLTNYRVSIDSSPEQVFDHLGVIVEKVAKKNGLGFVYGNELVLNGTAGTVYLETISSIPASPVTPYTGQQWDTLGGIMRYVFEDLLPSDTPVVVAPGIMSGNTDTSHYWDLSRNIYRYSPANLKDSVNKHTVNERLRFSAHLGSIAFYHQLLLEYCAGKGELVEQ